MGILLKILGVLALAALSGLVGRMGGAKGYHTLWRDWGCPTLRLAAIALIWAVPAKFWWVYVLVWLLSWGAFSTYWDWLFGFDNLWFSGFMAGIAFFPLVFVSPWLGFFTSGDAVLLCIVWGCLNKYLPRKPGRDVREEYWRYFSAL